MCIVFVALAVSWPRIVAWYEFRRQFEPLGRNVGGYPEYRHRKSGIVFVKLPGGTFRMGSPASEPEHGDDEGPRHEVILSPFLVAKYEVTQAQWKRVMGTSPSKFKGDDLPVEQVAWDDCQEFCEKTGLSLPTEAQWEYACRARTTGRYSGTGNLSDMGWHHSNSGGTTHPAGGKAANQFGLHDMHGNVAEWVEDCYQADFYQQLVNVGEPAVDPVCDMPGSGYEPGPQYGRPLGLALSPARSTGAAGGSSTPGTLARPSAATPPRRSATSTSGFAPRGRCGDALLLSCPRRDAAWRGRGGRRPRATGAGLPDRALNAPRNTVNPRTREWSSAHAAPTRAPLSCGHRRVQALRIAANDLRGL